MVAEQKPWSADENTKFNRAVTVPAYIADKYAEEAVREKSTRLLRQLYQNAKNETGREVGGALSKTNELGHMPIQPWHMGASNNWQGWYGSTGWRNYRSNNTAGHPLNNVTIRPNTFVGYWGWEDRVAIPKIEAIQEQLGNELVQVQDIYHMRYMPGQRILSPEVVKIQPKSTYQLQFKVKALGYSELKPTGWTVTYGSNMSKKSYYDTA